MISRNSSPHPSSASDIPPLLSALLAVVIIAVGLPAFILGLLLHRLSRRLSWNFSLWVLLLLPSAALLLYLFLHGLDHLIVRELSDYIQNAKRYQTFIGEHGMFLNSCLKPGKCGSVPSLPSRSLASIKNS